MNYCTLFNSQYLSRGLALYYSLVACAKDFHLTIFAFDDAAFDILTRLELSRATIISLKEFESQELLAVKPSRTIAEYCWTCTSSVILYCLEKLKFKEVCYLDADLYFWQDPIVLIQEAKAHSILITEHRYTKQYDNVDLSGKYCVQFMYFKNDQYGLEALYWWKAACLKWCYNRVEEGKFGDQKYLDDWLERFEKVKVLAHLGGGVAPWNVQQYDIEPENKIVKCVERQSGHPFDLVFYHFHGVKFINEYIDLGGYKLSNQVKNVIYKPYIKALLNIEIQLKEHSRLQEIIKTINLHCKLLKSFSIMDHLRRIKNSFAGNNNYYSLDYFRG
ncbi:MAG: glycosyl transferase [Proteobacteria bacterium]|nr:glycosyl transferase [Pseudomonadota bacterium]